MMPSGFAAEKLGPCEPVPVGMQDSPTRGSVCVVVERFVDEPSSKGATKTVEDDALTAGDAWQGKVRTRDRPPRTSAQVGRWRAPSPMKRMEKRGVVTAIEDVGSTSA